MLAFNFSLALSRYDARRNWVLEEANAIGSTANFTLMLQEPAQKPIFDLLRAYTAVRIGIDVSYDPAKLERDVARSLELQNQLWQHPQPHISPTRARADARVGNGRSPGNQAAGS